MTKHNKKRNTGIIYELLLRHVSSGIVEGHASDGDDVVSVIKRHFKPNTELYKEFRLFNALVKTDANTEYVADVVMREAKEVARKIDVNKLDEEKTVLIHHINHKFNKEEFYSRRIPDYRMYATIQTLINDWRNPNPNIIRRAEYEEKVRTWLLQKKQQVTLEEQATPEVNPLVLKIMSEKVGRKFSDALSAEQRTIVSAYVLGSDDQPSELTEILKGIKESTLRQLDDYMSKERNEILTEKIEMIKADVKSLSVENVDEDVISKFMTVSHLKDTLMEGE